MATFYWVGGNGNWDATTTTNWASSSGGAGGAGVPTSTDDVVFDANSSGGGNFAVTITGTATAPALCEDFTASSLSHVMTLTFGTSNIIECYGNMTWAASNFAFSLTGTAFTSRIDFKATTTGKTFTTNGVTSSSSFSFLFDGVGGGWSLGSSLTFTNTTILVYKGSFDTANYSMTVNSINSSFVSGTTGTRSVSLGSSSITLTGSAGPLNFTDPTDLTFNAGTSTITCSATSPTFTGGGQTFYNVTFSSTASGTVQINGVNTFNNLIFTSVSATGNRTVAFNNNQTINGTFTCGTANTNIRKMNVAGNPAGNQRTITLNGTLSSLNDVNFRDLNAAGTVSTPWTGTRIGNAGNLSNITADAPKTVYRVGTGNWSANQWSLSSGGAVSLDNFPLPQDAIIFDNNTTSGTHTVDGGWWLGSLDCSAVTSAITIANGSQGPQWYGDITLDSDITITATGGQWLFVKPAASGTQIITSAGVTFAPALNFASPGTIQFADNITTDRAATLTLGDLDLNDYTLTCLTFSSSNENTRSIDFGTTGQITVTGNNATVWTTATATNFTYAGTSNVVFNYSGSTGTRTVSNHSTGGTESNALNYSFTAGTDIVTISTSGVAKNVIYTGFTGAGNLTGTMYGNLVLDSGMTVVYGSSGTTFAATSGTQEITTNGVSIDRPLGVNAPNATVQLQDNLTLGSTRTFTLTAGTLDLDDNTLSTGFFVSTNSNTREIAFGTGQIDVTGNSATVWTTSIATNFTYTGTSKINFTYSGSTGTRTIGHGNDGSGIESNSLNYFFTSGTDIIALAGNSTFMTLDFTGFSGTLNNNTRTIYGNLTISSGMTLNSGSAITTFAATSGTQEITSNGKTLDFPVTVNAPGATVQLQDALTMGATRTLTLTAGTLDSDGYAVSTGLFNGSGTTARTLSMGASTWTITGAGTAWNLTDTTNLTLNTDTSTISMTGSSAHTFAGGSQTYYNLNVGGAGDLTIEGDNTFNEISDSVDGSTVYFTAGSTTTTTAFTVDGGVGDLILFRSTTPGSVWFLEQSTGAVSISYVDIQDSDASGGATFQCINGVNSGNNTGWQFIDSGGSGGNFFIFF